MIWLQIYYKKKPLPYIISEYGDIISLEVKAFLKYRRTEFDRCGYTKVTLRINKKSKKFLVHRLVALMFCPGYEEGKVVNHIDGNKQNNHYSNLEWVTPQENEDHARINGLKAINERNSRCKYPTEIVHLICRELATGKSVDEISKDMGIPYTYIWEVKNGKVRKRISAHYNIPQSSTTSESTEEMFDIFLL